MFFWQNIMELSMTHPATRCINLLLTLQNKLDIKENRQRRWGHQFMFAHKSVPHLSSQCALAYMAETLSFNKCNPCATAKGPKWNINVYYMYRHQSVHDVVHRMRAIIWLGSEYYAITNLPRVYNTQCFLLHFIASKLKN
jgi:hypothetical protein